MLLTLSFFLTVLNNQRFHGHCKRALDKEESRRLEHISLILEV